MKRTLISSGSKLESAKYLLYVSIAVIGPSCYKSGDARPKRESMINITSIDQLQSSVGKVVRLDGILYRTRGGTFVGCQERINVYLAPPPDQPSLKIGSKVSVVGTLTSRVVHPYDPNTSVPFAHPTDTQATTDYILINYKVTLVGGP